MVSKSVTPLRLLTLEDIVAIDDLPERDVYVEEWGGSVKVKAMPKGKVFDLRDQAMPGGEMNDRLFEMLLVVHGVIEPQFTPEHVGMLQTKSNAALDTILKVVLEINGMDKEATKRAKSEFPAEPGA